MKLEDALKSHDIVMKYRKWLNENNLKDKTESLLAFLYVVEYLKEKKEEIDGIKEHSDEEVGRFDECNDNFDLTIHFETEEERDLFLKSIDNYDKLKEAMEKIKKEIKAEADCCEKDDVYLYGLGIAFGIIDKYTEGLV